ncbi:hypothetical protein [Enterococcus phage vB_OCPT_SDS2]|nr:hypothetical protein [Enterococcus phage vB_OCPT_SDS2]
MNMNELECIYDSRKSFYGKANLVKEENGISLYSYDTKVATIYTNGLAKVFGTYSQTTLRHIKEFLKQNGLKADTKKQIEKDYM